MRECRHTHFGRFYVVTKFMLPTIGDIKSSRLNYNHTCAYMKKENAPNTDSRKYLIELRTYCNKIKPFVSYYSKLMDSCNKAVHNSLQNEIRLLLLITVSSFIGLAYEGISSFLQCKCKNALHKAVNAMNDQVNIQHNKLMKLDDTMLIYGI